MTIWEQIAAFLTNQQYALLASLIVPFIFKWSPKFKDFSNELCRMLALLAAFATNVFGASNAHAAVGPALVLPGFLSPVLSIAVSAIDARITEFLHDKFLNPLWKAIGMKKP